ncbi:LAQU0S07e02630g1_1 [Lachancea quebecensis]|uniref:Telomerase reverse transcriptase n=1 Tax=Lachancea quebecensis TaxID=1654605 RepID=A0A0P1KRT3_9SACH|nr:LAQU0S07e02630g1_1 [Lachancea quebecensis]
MKSLREFIWQCAEGGNDPELTKQTTGSWERADESFKEATYHYFVTANPTYWEVPSVHVNDQASVVDQCVTFLVEKKVYNNVLTFGYKAASHSQVSSALHCQSTNLNVTRLKCGIWKTLFGVLGSKRFVELIINHSIFESSGTTYTQITGVVPREQERAGFAQCRSSNKGQKYLDNSSFLYKNKGKYTPSQVMPCSPEALWEQIFQIDWKDFRLPHHSQLVRVRQLLSRVIRNHRRIRYHHVLNKICPRTGVFNKTGNRECETDIKLVSRFLVVIVEKTFPLEFFGSKYNRCKILSKIRPLLQLKLHGRMPLSMVTEGFRTGDIVWLGKNPKTGSRTAHSLQEIVVQLIEWVFKKFISSVICSVFHCCEISATREIVFFRFDVWKSMADPFLRTYALNYLKKKNEYCGCNGARKANHGCLRLVPKRKKMQFRVIFVPLRDCEPEKIAQHEEFIRKTIKPTICILQFLASEASPSTKKLSSPSDIASTICLFKGALKKTYGCVPKLYFIKFDIESCYDSIPAYRAVEVIEKHLTSHSEFFVRSQSYFDPDKGTSKRFSTLNARPFAHDGGVAIDKVQTAHFTGHEVLATVKSEIEKSAIIYEGKCYTRKKGIFQGASLSAAIVDLFYSDLVENESVFAGGKNSENLVLRLADDFLVLSTSKSYIESVERTVCAGFQEYNAVSNRDKILTHASLRESEYVRFCAMDLNLKSLEVLKHTETLSTMCVFSGSTRNLYHKLSCNFQRVLSNDLTDPNLNSLDTILKQIFFASTNVAESFCLSYVGKPAPFHGFMDFINKLTKIADESCKRIFKAQGYSSNARKIVYSVFMKFLKQNKMRVQNTSYVFRTLSQVIKTQTRTKKT